MKKISKNCLSIFFSGGLTILGLIIVFSPVFAQTSTGTSPENPTASLSAEAVIDETVEISNLEVNEPTLLPDNPLYFLKNISRSIQKAFVFNSVKKSSLRLKFASEKLWEAQKLAEKTNDAKVLVKAIKNYEEEINKIKEEADKIKEKAEENPAVHKFLDKFIQQQLLHEKILEKLEEKVSPEVLEKIKEARQNHLSKFGEVMQKLENKELIAKRLENVLNQAKGSDFKDFKNAELLEKLAENAPEGIKEKIEEVKENLIERIGLNLEQKPAEWQERFKNYVENTAGEAEKKAEILQRIRTKIQQREQNQSALQKLQILNEIRLRLNPLPTSTTSTSPLRTREKFCVAQWDPVCGKNGKTYSNSCFAKAAGVEIAHPGICENNTTTSDFREEEKIKPLTEEEARAIALESECAKIGKLSQQAAFNKFSQTWWIEMKVDEKVIREKNISDKMCNPACVVNAITKKAEINWRCTGLIK